jgi:hypothetical protein
LTQSFFCNAIGGFWPDPAVAAVARQVRLLGGPVGPVAPREGGPQP